MQPTNEPIASTPAQPADPQVALAMVVAKWTASGWRPESYGPGQVTLVSGRRANHVLHLLLSVFTLGLWLPIWLIVSLSSREERTVLVVDQAGQVHHADALRQASDARPESEGDREIWRDPVAIAALVSLAVVLVAGIISM